MQRVDVIVDGELYNVDQRSSNPALIARVVDRMQSARSVEIRRHVAPAPPPPPPTPGRRSLGHVLFHADLDDDAIAGALELPAYWTHAVTADRAYRSPELLRLIAELKRRGRVVRPWCDCREPDGDPPGTPYREALAMAEELELGEPIGQGESSAELTHALRAGARDLVANPSAWTPSERAMMAALIEAGTHAVSGEMYRPDAGYSAQGVPIYSVTYGVTLDGSAYVPLSTYLNVSTPAQRSTFCVYRSKGLRPADLLLLG